MAHGTIAKRAVIERPRNLGTARMWDLQEVFSVLFFLLRVLRVCVRGAAAGGGWWLVVVDWPDGCHVSGAAPTALGGSEGRDLTGVIKVCQPLKEP